MSLHRIPLLVKIIFAIILGIVIGLILPDYTAGAPQTHLVRMFNTFNGIFDQLLKFLIPLIIIGLVTSAIADIGKTAGRMLLITTVLAYGFTVASGLFSYFSSVTIFPSLIESAGTGALNVEGQQFPAYFTIEIPPMMAVMTALISSFLIGLGISTFGAKVLKEAFDELKDIVTLAIAKVIIPLLPVYIFGIFLDMTAAGKVGPVLTAFLQIIVVIFILTAILLLLQYTVAGLVTGRNPIKIFLTMLPAYFTALGTSSSAATIPVTLRQTEKNGVCPEVAGFTIPLCATIHMSGSTLKIVACAIAIMLLQGIPFDFPLVLGFIMMLGITMVAAPGVPGGCIMAALGILDSILGFNAEQQAMMITLYIAMDSFGTACNVTGDGAIALIVNKIKDITAKK